MAFPLAPLHLEGRLSSPTSHRYPGASSLLKVAGQEAGDGGGGGDGAGVIAAAAAVVVVVVVVAVADSPQVSNVAAGAHGGPFAILHHPPEGL